MTEGSPPVLTPANIGGPRELGHYLDDDAFQRFRSAYAAAFATLPPSTHIDVDTSFGRVRCYGFAEGAGTPLVLVPGSGAATPTWGVHLADLMGLDRPVIAIEPLGQPGASRQTRKIGNADDQAQWLDEVLVQLCPSGAHLLGASMGGWLSLQTALRAPARVRSVVALDPPSAFARLSASFIGLGLASAVPMLPSRWRARTLGLITGLDHSDLDDPVTGMAITAMTRFRTRLPVPSGLSDEQLRSIEQPALVLFGGRSRVHDAHRAGERAARLLPRASVEVWPDAGHALNAQFPERFAADLRAFLEEIETP